MSEVDQSSPEESAKRAERSPGPPSSGVRVDGPGPGLDTGDTEIVQDPLSSKIPHPRSSGTDDDGSDGSGGCSAPARASVWLMLEQLRRGLRRVTNVAMISLIIAVIGLGVAFQPDQFQRMVAAYYNDSVQIGDYSSSDIFVTKIGSISEGWWFAKRIWGTRIQFDEVEINNINGGAFGRVSEAPSEGKPGVIQLPTTSCPDGRGKFLRIFVHGATSSQFGTLDARQRRYVLDGLFDVGHVRSRYSEDAGSDYCYVDFFAVT